MVSTPTYINVDVKLSDALDQISVADVIQFFGYEEFLAEIGPELCKDYFSLIETNH